VLDCTYRVQIPHQAGQLAQVAGAATASGVARPELAVAGL